MLFPRVQTRISLFYLMSMFISGLSQILAYGLIQIPRAGMVHTWRWIFLVLGESPVFPKAIEVQSGAGC